MFGPTTAFRQYVQIRSRGRQRREPFQPAWLPAHRAVPAFAVPGRGLAGTLCREKDATPGGTVKISGLEQPFPLNQSANLCKRQRFPPAIIQYAVWLHIVSISATATSRTCSPNEIRSELRIGATLVPQAWPIVFETALAQTSRIRRHVLHRGRIHLRSHGESPWKIFSSPEHAQRFLSVHAVVYSLFNLQGHLVSAESWRSRRVRAFECWKEAVAA